jgi:hypothetical protein
MTVLNYCRKRNAEAMTRRRTDPEYRVQRRISNTNQRRLLRQDPVPRAQETDQRRLARTDPEYRIMEKISDTNRNKVAREKWKEHPISIYNQSNQYGLRRHYNKMILLIQLKCRSHHTLFSIISYITQHYDS